MTDAWRERLDLSQEVELEGSPAALFLARALERGVGRVRIDDWSTSASAPPAELGEPVMHVEGHGREHALFDHDGTLIELTLFPGHVAAAVADRDEDRVEATMARLQELLPPPEPSVRHEVPVTFWTYGRHGPMPSWRSIAVPGWEDIRANYPEPSRGKLEPLMTGFAPARGGQLILWHGRAGTGKTYALRALAWEWKDWCEFHYIVDPDAFFGQHADYLMNVLLQPSMIHFPGHAIAASMPLAAFREELVIDEGVVAAERDPEESGKSWKLLMLEDTGELLTADARAVIGQGLSRFLNVVDGLIGQGLRVLVLVTTNEEIRKLHPAVARPGRCAANVEFVSLPVEEANAWLAARGIETRVERATTLAALYAVAEGLDPGEAVIEAGFGG